MAGNGRRASKIAAMPLLSSPEEPVGPELPDVRPDTGDEWLPVTRRWYEDLRRSPLAQRMGVGPDWDFVLDTALLKDDFKRSRKGRAILAAEIRQREAMIGVTPKARNDLKFDAPQANDLKASSYSGSSNVISMEEVRRQRRAVG